MKSPVLIVGIVIFMLTGCYSESDYSGDGKLVDKGPFASIDRYVLNLGSVDLNKIGRTTYRIANLPSKNFIAGIDFHAGLGNQKIIANKKINTFVSLTLLDSAGEKIFNKKERLVNWTWAQRRSELTKAFICGRGSGLQETYFAPKPHAEYILTFTVLQIDPNKPKHYAALVLKSNGWK